MRFTSTPTLPPRCAPGQARLNSLPTSSRPSLDEDDMPLATTSSSSTATRGPGGPLGSDDDVGSGFDMRPLTGGSFSDADDGDLAVALNRRIGQIAASTASFDSEVTEEEMRQPLTGEARDGASGAWRRAVLHGIQCGRGEVAVRRLAVDGRAGQDLGLGLRALLGRTAVAPGGRGPHCARGGRLIRVRRVRDLTGQVEVPGTQAVAR